MFRHLDPEYIFTFSHDTCMVEFERGKWTPVCIQCGPLLDARINAQPGRIMLEEHERHVPHKRGPDRTFGSVEPHLYVHCRA